MPFLKSSVELNIEEIKPSYMALKQDECNATVEVGPSPDSHARKVHREVEARIHQKFIARLQKDQLLLLI